MKNLTVLAAALAAGLTTFAANAQGEGSTRVAMLSARPEVTVMDRRNKDDRVEKVDEKATTGQKRGLTAEEVFHAAKSAAAEAMPPKQKDDVVTIAATRKQKDDVVVAANEPPQKDDVVTIATTRKQKDDVAALAPKPRDRYKPIIAKYALENGIAIELAHAVITVESNYKPNSLGNAGEVGLMQIKPATAKLMGYKGTKAGLFDPETNIKYGMKYLGKAQELGDGTTCGTILKYNAGHAAKRMNPVSRNYCKKVKLHLATLRTALLEAKADFGPGV